MSYVKNHDSFKKFISKRVQRKRTETKNQTRPINDVNESAAFKSKEITELKSGVQPKDEL